MWHVNITEFFNFLVLVSLFLGISAEFSGVVQKTEREIAHKVNFLRNFGETFEKSYTLAAHRGKYLLNSSNNVCNRRRVRNIEPEEKHEHNLECYECDSSSGYKEGKSCYDGNILSTTNCDASAQCYLDLKPQYIKRGCLVPNKKKQTFYCRCPLCNNKPTNEFSYFNRDVSEWEFDNYRLLTDEISDPFQCITCKTKGLNSTDDDLCRTGVGVGKTVCRSYSACYTNINHETSEVSRGCISLPAYNSIYFLCNHSLCNGGSFTNSIFDRNYEHPILRRILHRQQPCQQVQVIFDADKIRFNGSWIVTAKFRLMFLIVLITLIFFSLYPD